MNIKEILALLGAKVVCGGDYVDRQISYGFASDLMSDVLTISSATGELLLITGLANIQTIRTAEMSEIRNIVFVRGKKADADMISLAKDNEILLMESPYSMYRASGLLWKAGLPPKY